jgi:hypothetical protein
VIITTGATVITVMGGSIAGALVPLIVALLTGFVAYGRWRLVPGIGATRPVRGAATPGSAARPAKA